MKRLFAYAVIPLSIAAVLLLMFIPMLFDAKGYQRVALSRPIDDPWFERYSHRTLLLFFGYAGCRDVCTPRLGEIAAIYRMLKVPEEAGVLFVNLVPVVDPALPQQFARYFDKRFMGVYPGELIVNRLQKQFDLYIGESLLERGAYNHTSTLYVLHKEEGRYVLRYMYTHSPLDEELVLEDLSRL